MLLCRVSVVVAQMRCDYRKGVKDPVSTPTSSDKQLQHSGSHTRTIELGLLSLIRLACLGDGVLLIAHRALGHTPHNAPTRSRVCIHRSQRLTRSIR